MTAAADRQPADDGCGGDFARDAVRELAGPQVACRNCAVFALCLPVGMGSADLSLLERVIKRRRIVRRGEHVFRAGNPFHSVYAVKSGALKTYVPLAGDAALVTGFHLPGELVGLDAAGAGIYQYSARALLTTSLCELPFDQFEALGGVVTGLQRQLVRLIGGQIGRDVLLRVLHCRRSAEARLAAFLVDLSERFARRGFAASEFRLPMSRTDIGSYLGLTKETVSRLCTEFHQRGLLAVAGRQVKIRDAAGLRALADLPPILQR